MYTIPPDDISILIRRKWQNREEELVVTFLLCDKSLLFFLPSLDVELVPKFSFSSYCPPIMSFCDSVEGRPAVEKLTRLDNAQSHIVQES